MRTTESIRAILVDETREAGQTVSAMLAVDSVSQGIFVVDSLAVTGPHQSGARREIFGSTGTAAGPHTLGGLGSLGKRLAGVRKACADH